MAAIDEFCPQDTRDHIFCVREEIQRVTADLQSRSLAHDRSKCEEPERSGFAQMAEELRLADTTYGSDEYRAILRKYKESTIDHHYRHNDHHPEHFKGDMLPTLGLVSRMNLMQIIEMLCDWKAATGRMKDGDIRRSIDLNAERFGYGPELRKIFLNTADALGW